ncbi:MAG: amino acid transporter [Phenylobacterium sp.]|uniref:nucleotidyltransferase domain-containing protein n=1 Tax=Phenylobacterium sp. TaxID=1871053 RepID=UPI0025D6D3B2|nr:hypothetical protein [Phenylobacterium sp.]MBI1198871.1 amino acid transporter [Phenylobacterium sp.]
MGRQLPWWVAGGWALDLSLGRRTRRHADIDIAVPRTAQAELAVAFEGWDIRVASGGTLTPWVPGDWLEGGARHQFWMRQDPSRGWMIEVLLEEGGPEWVFRRRPEVRRPWTAFGRRSVGGIPYVAPEVALLYKAAAHQLEKNAADFDEVSPHLQADQRAWLARALAIAHPGHPWSARLT